MSDAPAPFLDPDPPHWAARGLAYFLLAAFVTACAASVLVRVPRIALARAGPPVRHRAIVVSAHVQCGAGCPVDSTCSARRQLFRRCTESAGSCPRSPTGKAAATMIEPGSASSMRRTRGVTLT